MKTIYVAAAAGAMFLAGAAYVLSDNMSAVAAEPDAKAAVAKKPAAPRRPRAARWFEDGDANKDGKLSNEEFHAAHEKYFQTTDANKDGVITREEMRARREANRPPRPAANKDAKAKK